MKTKRLFIPFTSIFASLGILLFTRREIFSIITMVFALTFNFLVLAHKDKARWKTIALTLLYFLFVGAIFFSYTQLTFERIDRDLKDNTNSKDNIYLKVKQATIKGYICKVDSLDKSLRFEVQTKTFKYIAETRDLSLIDSFVLGDIVQVKGSFSKPKTNFNKGQVDNILSTYAKNISGTIYFNKSDIKKLGENKLYSFVEKLQSKFLNRAKAILEGETFNLAKKLISGNYDYQDKILKDKLLISGLSHLFSISGTHFSLLIFPLYKALKYISKNKLLVLIPLIVICLFFLVFTGLSTGAIRSFISLIGICIADIFSLDKNKYVYFSLSVLLVYLFNPLILFDLSFLLSYGAIFSIIIFQPIVNKGFKKITSSLNSKIEGSDLKNNTYLSLQYERLKKSKVSIVFNKTARNMLISISVLPGIFLLNYKLFHIVYSYSLISNLLALPFILPMILSLWLSPIYPTFFLKIFEVSSNLIMKIVDKVASWENAYFYLKDIHYVLITLSILIVILLFNKDLFKKIHYHLTLFILLLVLTLSSIFIYSSKVVFFDVGQGDSCLFSLANGKTYLIDTGAYISPSVIAYYAGNKLDGVFISHGDQDHCGAIFNLLDEFKINNIYFPLTDFDKNTSLIKEIKEYYNLQVKELEYKDYIQGKSFKIDVLSPDRKSSYKDINDASMVLRVSIKGINFLFTGDGDISKMHNILQDIDILKLPHHGDSKKLSKSLFENQRLSTGIISVGLNNSYNLPHESTIDIFMQNKIKILRTDYDGSVEIYILFNNFFIFKEK